MRCKYCDEFTGICCNGECPMRADVCPVPETEGLCRFEDREEETEETYQLTPKGCAACAMLDADLVKHSEDPRVDRFWELFTDMMRSNGYLQEDLP